MNTQTLTTDAGIKPTRYRWVVAFLFFIIYTIAAADRANLGVGQVANLRAGLVDELHLTICPKIFGGRAAPSIADGLGATTLARAVQLEASAVRKAGDEIFLVYRVRGRGR